VKKEKSRIKYIKIPIQLELWENEVVFRGRDRQQYMDTHGQSIKSSPKNPILKPIT
jgi:hypothetical protein